MNGICKIMAEMTKLPAAFVLCIAFSTSCGSPEIDEPNERIISITRRSEILEAIHPVIRADILRIDSFGVFVTRVDGDIYLTRTTVGHILLKVNFKLLAGDLIELTPNSKLTLENAGRTVELSTLSDTYWYKFELLL